MKIEMKCKVLPQKGITSGISTQWRPAIWKTALQRKTWILLDELYHEPAKVSNSVPDCIRKSVTRKPKEAILPLHSVLVKPAGSSSGLPSTKNTRDILQQVQQKATKIIEELAHLSEEEKLEGWGRSALRRDGSRGISRMCINT